MFTGLMYNDIFSKSLHIWHSGWDFPDSGNRTVLNGSPNGHVYPFGLDPGWHGAENSLVFTNSYKMKMSIIIGVIHVSFLYNYSPFLLSTPFNTDDICYLSPSPQPYSLQKAS